MEKAQAAAKNVFSTMDRPVQIDSMAADGEKLKDVSGKSPFMHWLAYMFVYSSSFVHPACRGDRL